MKINILLYTAILGTVLSLAGCGEDPTPPMTPYGNLTSSVIKGTMDEEIMNRRDDSFLMFTSNESAYFFYGGHGDYMNGYEIREFTPSTGQWRVIYRLRDYPGGDYGEYYRDGQVLNDLMSSYNYRRLYGFIDSGKGYIVDRNWRVYVYDFAAKTWEMKPEYVDGNNTGVPAYQEHGEIENMVMVQGTPCFFTHRSFARYNSQTNTWNITTNDYEYADLPVQSKLTSSGNTIYGWSPSGYAFTYPANGGTIEVRETYATKPGGYYDESNSEYFNFQHYFSLNGKIYVKASYNNTGPGLYEYDPASDKGIWKALTGLNEYLEVYTLDCAFTINGRGYLVDMYNNYSIIEIVP